jgi:hypothetical protein
MPIIAPIAPTGPKILMAIGVAFAAAGVCTKFLTLDMPFGEWRGKKRPSPPTSPPCFFLEEGMQYLRSREDAGFHSAHSGAFVFTYAAGCRVLRAFSVFPKTRRLPLSPTQPFVRK